MTAGIYNFTLEQGATFTREIVYRDSNNALINLTGYSARMQIRPYKDSGDILVNATTANGKLSVSGASGKITIVLSPTDTNTISFDEGVYDLEIEDADGAVTRLLEGRVTFSKQVTR